MTKRTKSSAPRCVFGKRTARPVTGVVEDGGREPGDTVAVAPAAADGETADDVGVGALAADATDVGACPVDPEHADSSPAAANRAAAADRPLFTGRSPPG